MMREIFFFILVGLILVCPLQATPPSCRLSNKCGLKAAWLPTSYDSSSYPAMQYSFESLQSIGICRVYVDVWNNGIVYFNSPTMIETVGYAGQGQDHLGWAIAIGHQLGMEVYAWFEYGLMAGYGPSTTAFKEYAIMNNWTIGDYNNYVWMDPTNADVVNFINGIMKDSISSSYKDIDGFQFDDHYGYPASLSSHSSSDSLNIMTNLTSFLRQTSFQTNPLASFSLSPNPLSLSKSTYNVDWDLYGQKGYYDETIPQLYRSSYADYNNLLFQTLSQTSPQTQSLMYATGLRIDGTGSETPWNDLDQMMDENERNKLGFAFWYAKGVEETYPTQLESYFSQNC